MLYQEFYINEIDCISKVMYTTKSWD